MPIKPRQGAEYPAMACCHALPRVSRTFGTRERGQGKGQLIAEFRCALPSPAGLRANLIPDEYLPSFMCEVTHEPPNFTGVW